MNELDRLERDIQEWRQRLQQWEERRDRLKRALWDEYMRERNNELALLLPSGI